MTALRSQAEIRARFDALSGDDWLGFRREALLDAMEYETVRDIVKEGVEPWPAPDVAQVAREYLVFAIGKAVDHRGISASRSIEKLTEWLWCLGEDRLTAEFEAAPYAPYGAPQLAVLVDAWQVEHEYADDPQWVQMRDGLSCRDGCDEGCD